MTSITLEKKAPKPYIKILIRLVISIGLLTWLGWTIDWSQLGTVLKGSSSLNIVFALLAIQLTVFSSIWKWQMLVYASVHDQEKQQVSLGRLGKLYYIGLFFNNFLPSSVGGDVVRIFQLGKTIGMTKSAASVAFERLTSGGALVILLIGSAILSERARPFLGSILLLCALFVSIFLILWFLMKKSTARSSEKIREETGDRNVIMKLMETIKDTLLKIGETVGDYRNQNRKWWFMVIVLSLAFQVGLVWINDLLFTALHVEVPFLELLVFITLISALTMLPISINGLGVREVSYVFFFQKLGVSDEISMSVSLLFFILVLVSSLLGGVFWLNERR